jgi:peptidyl-tRNA hydrolase, PTH1 family
MFLIIGLGNPGKKYEGTRHNIGSRVIDELGSLNLENIILAKPKTFMNESGKAVKGFIKKYKIKPENLIVIHDDIDIPIGKIKISKDSGAGGHKGVESIIGNIGTKNFIRIRVGIQPKRGKPERVESFVLKKFTKDEEKLLKETLEKIPSATEMIIKGKAELAMTEFNK